MSLYLLVYGLWCALVVWPPAVFSAAGLTLAQVVSAPLGSETQSFVMYHVRRAALTQFAHSALPLGYLVGLLLRDSAHVDLLMQSVFSGLLWKAAWTVSLMAPVYVALKVVDWYRDNWIYHPVFKNLAQYCDSNTLLSTLVDSVDVEYRSVDKIIISTNETNKIIVSNSWIVKVGFYDLKFAQQSDSILIVKTADTHQLSPTSGGEQFINIEVKSMRKNCVLFHIRINSLDFKDLQSKVSRPIVVLPNIVFHKTIIDKFIEVFLDQISLNNKYETNQDLEPCIGCMQTVANIKLSKSCSNIPPRDQDTVECQPCGCRPMWCADCMGRWFATRQDPEHPEMWLSNKCTCPLCRQVFCLLDVHYVQPRAS